MNFICNLTVRTLPVFFSDGNQTCTSCLPPLLLWTGVPASSADHTAGQPRPVSLGSGTAGSIWQQPKFRQVKGSHNWCMPQLPGQHWVGTQDSERRATWTAEQWVCKVYSHSESQLASRELCRDGPNLIYLKTICRTLVSWQIGLYIVWYGNMRSPNW